MPTDRKFSSPSPESSATCRYTRPSTPEFASRCMCPLLGRCLCLRCSQEKGEDLCDRLAVQPIRLIGLAVPAWHVDAIKDGPWVVGNVHEYVGFASANIAKRYCLIYHARKQLCDDSRHEILAQKGKVFIISIDNVAFRRDFRAETVVNLLNIQLMRRLVFSSYNRSNGAVVPVVPKAEPVGLRIPWRSISVIVNTQTLHGSRKRGSISIPKAHFVLKGDVAD